jgi:hypothetical protein
LPVFLPGPGYGLLPYGLSPYGSGAFPRPPVAVTSGYGGYEYGYSSYGSVDLVPPRVSGAASLDGYRIEVYFSEEMRPDAALSSTTSYTPTALLGVPLTFSSVSLGTEGPNGGYTSVILTHGGTTLGGEYQVTVSGVEDLAGNPIGPAPVATASFFALGDETSLTVVANSGNTLLLSFLNSLGGPQNLLTEAQFSPGTENLNSYQIDTDYPVAPTLTGATHPVAGDLSKVQLGVSLMTATTYDMIVGPAEAISYKGNVLPSADPSFGGTELGVGTSSASSATRLLLSKSAANFYGWGFQDLTGKLVPGSSFRQDFNLNATGASISPPVVNALFGTLSVSDGGVQIDITLEDVMGTRVVGVTSGGFTAQVPFNWISGGTHQISLIRNQKGGFYSLVIDDVAFLTFPVASATGVPLLAPGAAVVLAAGFDVGLFKVLSLLTTATSTIFTSAWNFLHGLTETFIGSGVYARDRIYTRRGPLVKSWGDTTPATQNDVTVRVNGVPVSVDSVNPYEGEIYPSVPIPLSVPGTVTVEVDYQWFRTPNFPLAGLNVRGLNLNAWAQKDRRTSSSTTSQIGFAQRSRFSQGVVLAPYRRKRPLQVGHRYYGWQRAYSALLNQYTSLRLNQNPHTLQDGKLRASSEPSSATFFGTSSPTVADPSWVLLGQDGGSTQGETYQVLSDTAQGAVYYREVDLTRSSQVLLAGRLLLQSSTPDGVFTGVGFGAQDNASLVLAGLVTVGGFKSVGFLLDPSRPDLESSWKLGPSFQAKALGKNLLSVSLASWFLGITAGDRLRIPSGAQAGIYEIAECGIDSDGTSVFVTLTGDLPAPIDVYGNDLFQVLVEVPFEESLTSYRLSAVFPKGSAELYLGGRIGGLALSLSDIRSVGYTAQTALLIPTGPAGSIFWGAPSRRARSSALWDFVKYGVLPASLLSTSTGFTVSSPMTELPQDEADPWFVGENFGYAQIDSSGNTLLLKKTSADLASLFTFGYRRLEPFLTYKGVTTDFRGTFRVDSCTGSNEASLQVEDGQRKVTLANLQFITTSSTRTLYTLGRNSLTGVRLPEDENWVVSGSPPTPNIEVQGLLLQKTSLDAGFWAKNLSPATPSGIVTGTGLALEARVLLSTYTLGAGASPGLLFRALVPDGAGTAREVQLSFSGVGPSLRLTDFSYGGGGNLPFSWNDGQVHTYRLLIDVQAGAITVSVDDSLLGLLNLSLFPLLAHTGEARTSVGFQGTGTFTGELYYFNGAHLGILPGAFLEGKTLGLLKRDRDGLLIDDWVIPRTDGLSVHNSDPSCLPVQMDWASDVQVRLRVDPLWGASLYRPDLPPPPGFTSPEFVDETTDPNGAWANLEYRDLPKKILTYPETSSLSFGSFSSSGISQLRWKDVSYTLRGKPNGAYLAPTGMVLNRGTPLTSGEYLLDKTPEVQTILSRTKTQVSIWDSHRHASRVFHVQVDGTLLPQTAWSFSEGVITLQNPLPENNYPVTVTFSIGKPVTSSYLCSSPLEETQTVLNEGTPPVPKNNYDEPSTRVVSTDPLDPTESSVTYVDGPDSKYVGLTFCESSSGDSVLLTPARDELTGLAIEGTSYKEFLHTRVVGGPGGTFGHGSPSVPGSSTHFYPAAMLTLGGGVLPRLPQNVLNGPAILQPNQSSSSGQMGLNQDFRLVLKTTTPYSESPPPPSDNTAPDGSVNPNGNGAALAVVTDAGGTGVSYLGPWGGLSSLTPSSLLGGGAQSSSSSFILNGGAALPLPASTTIILLSS